MILHPTSFFPTRIERVELARRRYFEDGYSPSGVVSDAVFQSWARSQRLHGDPTGKLAFEAVSTSRTQLSLQRNRSLHDAWHEELPHLQVVLASTRCGAILTDSSGVLLGATCSRLSHEES
jgi:transcriptional regulator of acetoin/glycerol metabolism